jgi:hypothetical protein
MHKPANTGSSMKQILLSTFPFLLCLNVHAEPVLQIPRDRVSPAIKVQRVRLDAGTVVPSEARQRAMTLNTQGFRLYRQGKLPDALSLFQQAIQADPTHAMAHYNYAATLGVLRKKKQICPYDAYKTTIVQHLSQAVALDPQRRERMKQDADFSDVRDTLGYQKLLGLDPKKPGDLPLLIERVSWYGPGQGVFGSTVSLDFKPRGVAELWYRDIPQSESQQMREARISGSWKMNGTEVQLRLNQPYRGKQDFRGTLSENGRLQLEEPLGALLDFPSECDA